MQVVNAREYGAILVGVGSAFTLIFLLVLQLFTGVGLFGIFSVTSTVTTNQTVTVTAMPPQLVAEAVGNSFANYILLLDSRNVSALVSQYQVNATVTWTGQEGPAALRGSAVGKDNITSALNAFMFQPCGPRTTVNSFAVGNVTRSIAAVSDASATMNSIFSFSGNSTLWGSFNGTISAKDVYSYSGSTGTWLISRETWNFLHYGEEYPVNPGLIC